MNFYAFFGRPTPETLEANRRGILTPEQRIAIERRAGSYLTQISFMTGLVLMPGLMTLIIFWLVDREDGAISPMTLVVGTGIVAACLVGFGLLRYHQDKPLLWVRGDLEDGRLESVRGRVVWKGNGYRAESDSRPIRTLRWGAILPPPGNYDFYVLPRTGLVVLAESPGELYSQHSGSLLLNALAGANDFSIDDLSANREGRLSNGQQNRLMGILAVSGLAALSGAVLCGISAFTLLGGGRSSPPFYMLLALVGLLLSVRFAWSSVRLAGDVWTGEVRSVEGPVYRQSYRSRYTRSHYYVIDRYRFYVSPAAFNALLEGKPYRIYYSPHSKRLAAIEPIDE